MPGATRVPSGVEDNDSGQAAGAEPQNAAPDVENAGEPDDSLAVQAALQAWGQVSEKNDGYAAALVDADQADHRSASSDASHENGLLSS